MMYWKMLLKRTSGCRIIVWKRWSTRYSASLTLCQWVTQSSLQVSQMFDCLADALIPDANNVCIFLALICDFNLHGHSPALHQTLLTRPKLLSVLLYLFLVGFTSSRWGWKLYCFTLFFSFLQHIAVNDNCLWVTIVVQSETRHN